MTCNFCAHPAVKRCEFKGCSNSVCIPHSFERKITHYGTAVTSVSGSQGNISSQSAQFVSHIEKINYCDDCNTFLNFLDNVSDYKEPGNPWNFVIPCTLYCGLCCCLCCLVLVPQVKSLNERSATITNQYPLKFAELNQIKFKVNNSNLYVPKLREKMNTVFVTTMTFLSLGDSCVDKPQFQGM